jgi:hypothetical protein
LFRFFIITNHSTGDGGHYPIIFFETLSWTPVHCHGAWRRRSRAGWDGTCDRRFLVLMNRSLGNRLSSRILWELTKVVYTKGNGEDVLRRTDGSRRLPPSKGDPLHLWMSPTWAHLSRCRATVAHRKRRLITRRCIAACKRSDGQRAPL